MFVPSVVDSVEGLVSSLVWALFNVEESNGMGIVRSAASKWTFEWPSHEAMLNSDARSNG